MVHELEHRLDDLFVGAGRLPHLYWIEYGVLQSIAKLQARLDMRRLERGIHPRFDGMVLLFDACLVLRVDRCDGSQHRVSRRLVGDIRLQLDHELVPGVIGARHLLVQGRAGLEKDGVRKDGDAAGRVQLRAGAGQLHHVEADQAHVDHVARYPGNGDAVAHADAVAPDDKKVSRHREQDGLQTDRDTGRNEPGKGG